MHKQTSLPSIVTYCLLPLIGSLLFFSSCKNRTERLLTKKWDCMQVENLDLGSGFQTKQDSVNTIQVMAALQTLSWTFKDDHAYECSIGSKVMVEGTYGIMEDGKTLICTPSSKNNINSYTIQALTENDLILASPPLVLHFKPH